MRSLDRGVAHFGAFTLVELLAVIAIMSILIVVALPVFESFTRRSLSTCVPELASTLRLARQHAITHRENVFVVFPDMDDITQLSGGQVDKALRSYAVIASNRSQGLYYVTDWKYLPKGVYFIDDPPRFGNGVLGSYGPLDQTRFPFPNERSADLQRIPALQFRPSGRAFRYDGGWTDFSNVQIPLTEGVADINTNAGSVSVTMTSTNYLMIRITSKTGKMDFVGL